MQRQLMEAPQMQVEYVFDFVGRPSLAVFLAVFGDYDAEMVCSDEYGQRWSAFVEYDPDLRFVRAASRHPSVCAVQEADFASDFVGRP